MSNRVMKDSGIEWIGEIPESWYVTKLFHCLNKNDGGTWGEFSENGYIALRSTEITIDGYWNLSNPVRILISESEFLKNKLFSNDLLITKSSGSLQHIGKAALVTEEIESMNCVYSNFMQRIRTNEKLNSKFLFLIFNNTLFKEQINFLSTTTTGLSNLNQSMINNLKLPLPPLHEQQAIATYLDEQVSRLDQLIEDQQQVIEDWKAYKQSLITETVTKGLNPEVEMKDSGIEWIGEIPNHWEVSKVRWILKFKSIKNKENEEVLSLYREHGVVPKNSRTDNHNVTSEDTSSYKFVEKGDFVVNKMKAWQGSMALSNYQGIVSPAYYVYSFINDDNFKKYFHYLLRNKTYLPEYERLSGGIRIGQWDLSREQFKMIPVLIPPLPEQQQIADFLDEKCSKIDQLIEDKQRLIEDLKAYKQSLIYECVTGKKEIV